MHHGLIYSILQNEKHYDLNTAARLSNRRQAQREHCDYRAQAAIYSTPIEDSQMILAESAHEYKTASRRYQVNLRSRAFPEIQERTTTGTLP